MEIYGYRRNCFKTFLTWLAIVATGFLLRLVIYWRPQWMLYLAFERCSMEKAEKVLLIDEYNQYFVEKVDCIHGASKSVAQHLSDTLKRSKKGAKYASNYKNDNYIGDQSTYDDARANSRKDKRLAKQLELELENSTDSLDGSSTVRYFENKKIRYIWNDECGSFIPLAGLDKNVTFSRLQTMLGGLDKTEQWRRRQLYGENAIHIEVQPYLRILFEEVLGPFYIFQLFSITVWFNDNYYYYGTCIIVMSLLSLVSSVIQIRRNQQQLRDTVESVDYVKVCRGDDQFEDVESSQLVPGDIVVVPTHNSILQFDGVLINGNVIVNESMLTGESVPVTKTPLPLHNYFTKTTNGAGSGSGGDDVAIASSGSFTGTPAGQTDVVYDEKEHNKHTLFCGTKVMQTRYYGGVYVRALVIRVGFQTAKGELIRSIMFPKPVDFRFNKQIHKFIGVLACLALVGFAYSVGLKTQRGADVKQILISALDLITIVIPPALPAAMTIGIIYAQSRLKSNKIFCISPRSINNSGCINCVCFDKTGTLTEDNLSFNEVVPLMEESCEFGRPFDEDVMQTSSKQVERMHHLLLDNGDYSPLMICLAACHSLTIIDQEIIGDPLDLQMFEATGWVLEEPDVDDENKFDLLAPTVVRPPKRKRRTPSQEENYAASSEFPSSASSTEDELDVVSVNANKRCQRDVAILRQLPFSSSLQRMSVVTRQFSGSQFVIYTKGAPEKIASLCDPSTVPEDFSDILHGYTRKGFRVLALAYRPMKVGLTYTKMQRATRQEIEKDLRFLGFLTLGNLLKPETIPVISKLNKANIRSVMVTGDNMLTAISVANECGMIQAYDKTILVHVEKKRDKTDRTSSSSAENLRLSRSASSTSAGAIATTTTASDGGADEDPKTIASTTSKVSADSTAALTSSLGNPLILNVENIQLHSNTESDHLLGPKRSKRPQKPRLVWHHVNNEQQQPSGAHEVPQEPQASASVRLDLDTDELRTHLALTGETWDVILQHYPELVSLICVRGTVFARMAPNQKQQLVEQLQALQYYVGMCGDGANDSGALRAAHAGISLSDTEASVAAPFTSANANISCVPILISEGRAALVTAFGILKYMALYSLIQFCSVLMLYSLYTNFTDMEFLYEDLFIIASLVTLFGRTEPYPSLDSKAPPSSLLSVTQLSSVSIQLALVIFFQALSLFTLWQNPWYEAHPPSYDHELSGHDNFAIFAMSAFQCISLAVVFSKGKPYRKSITSNYLFTAALVLITLLTITILIIEAEWNVPYISLEVLNVPIQFRLIIVCLAFTHFVAAMIGERFIVDHLIFRKSEKFLELLGVKPNVPLFESIDRKTRDTQWLSKMAKESA